MFTSPALVSLPLSLLTLFHFSKRYILRCHHIEFGNLPVLWRSMREDFWTFLLCAVFTVSLGTQIGLLCGIFVSLVVTGIGRCRSKQKGAESKPTLSVASSIHVVDAKTSLDFLTRIAISRDAEKALHVEIRFGCYVERRVHRMHHRSAQCELSRRKRSGSIVCVCLFIL